MPERARFEELRRSGLDALYNIDYDKQIATSKRSSSSTRIIRVVINCWRRRLWIKTLYESRRLQVSLYSSESFYTNGDDKGRSEDRDGVSQSHA
jgi:hypothetical protein